MHTHAGPLQQQSVKLVIKVEEPILLTLQVGNVEQSEAQLERVTGELSSLRQQLADYQAQLADKGGVLKTAQGQLNASNQALGLERQRTHDLSQEVSALSSTVEAARKAAEAASAAAAGEGLSAVVRQYSLSAPSSRRTTDAVSDSSNGPSSSVQDAITSATSLADHKSFKPSPSIVSQVCAFQRLKRLPYKLATIVYMSTNL